MHKLLIASLALVSATASAAPKPLLTGSYQLLAGKSKADPELIDIGQMIVTNLPNTIWGRIYITFDGNQITVGSQVLQKEDGAFTACRATATSGIAWTAKGFTLASKLGGATEYTTFKTLTSTTETKDDNRCNASFDAGTYTLGKDGDKLTLTSKKGDVLIMAPVDDIEKTDFRKYLPVPKKK